MKATWLPDENIDKDLIKFVHDHETEQRDKYRYYIWRGREELNKFCFGFVKGPPDRDHSCFVLGSRQRACNHSAKGGGQQQGHLRLLCLSMVVMDFVLIFFTIVARSTRDQDSPAFGRRMYAINWHQVSADDNRSRSGTNRPVRRKDQPVPLAGQEKRRQHS